jgi:tRNA-dihydrouridine synthase 3
MCPWRYWLRPHAALLHLTRISPAHLPLPPPSRTHATGRGPLIKPWLFTEIKERRTWDISSSERLDLLRRFARYGMEHWGSDSLGVETTRRFLCEWLSFAHRYVPVGILERVPQRMNDRPPAFLGRDQLETWMGSAHAGDWVRLTELVLGPAPASFRFTAKHRSNSYEVSE